MTSRPLAGLPKVGAPLLLVVLLLAALLLAALLLAGCAAAPAERRPIGLNTSLPIMWSEAADISGHLAGGDRHWLLDVLGNFGDVRALDSLSGPNGVPDAAADGVVGGVAALGPDGLLVLAQPYPLSPQENVALDDWVRGGGRVLLFADPMLDARSIFALGDRRRPQDVALLSPILARWGLELTFDEDQAAQSREIEAGDAAIPVWLAGRFAVRPEASCVIQGQGLMAECAIGKGRVLAIADATMLDRAPAESVESRKAVAARLLARLSR